MIQGGGGTRFPAKPLQTSRIACRISSQKLERHEPPEALVAGLANDAHASASPFA
jgi:hypothetical protein